MMSGLGVDYTPEKFDVLENVYFNAQYGWLPDGYYRSPAMANTTIWMVRTAASATGRFELSGSTKAAT